MTKPDTSRSRPTTATGVGSQMDLAPQLEVRGSTARSAGLLLLSVVMTLSSAYAFTLVHEFANSPLKEAVLTAACAVGVPFFALATLVTAKRLFTHGRVVITVSELGIRDVRLTRETVRWDEIERVSTWGAPGLGGTMFILGLTPAAWERLTLTTITRLTRRANRALSADGLAVTAQGTQISSDELLLEITSRHEAARHQNTLLDEQE